MTRANLAVRRPQRRAAGPAARTLFVLTFLGIGACTAGDHAVGPDTAARAETAAFVGGFDPTGVLTFLEVPDLTADRSARKLIRARDGGFVEIQGFRVDIPARALSRDTWITIDLPSQLPEALYVVAEFGPSGTVFRKPVRLTMPLSGVDLSGISLDDVGIWFWNGTAWEDHGGVARRRAVRATTTHFSKYGARGIDTTSGG
jgi:hypothetical protein